jgi:nucleoside-diphosphate-sugar epimerase
MTGCVFLAGASGVIGRALTPMLIAAGWRVVGTTRSADKAEVLKSLGVEPVVVDAFDATAVNTAVAGAQPDVVIHQLTDLPFGLDPDLMPDALVRNARLREEGTRNLVAAAVAAGARRLVAQSIAFVYAPGPTPHGEDDPLAVDADGLPGVSARGVASLERQVLEAPLAGVILRYGALYGPGTGADTGWGPGPVHIDAAARAAALAVEADVTGVFNIAEADGAVSSEKAQRLLGWRADWRAG